MHDILTVSEACNVETNGAPSAEYSWFPGYTWTVALCANCMVHVGWRYAAIFTTYLCSKSSPAITWDVTSIFIQNYTIPHLRKTE